MGPRSHERGNPIPIRTTPIFSSWLQWGRVLMNAETIQRTLGRCYGRWLQWGRVLMNAETAHPWLG